MYIMMETLVHHGSMDFASCTVVVVHHLQTVLNDFINNKSFLLWSQKLLSIYNFHMEKILACRDTSGGLQTWADPS